MTSIPQQRELPEPDPSPLESKKRPQLLHEVLLVLVFYALYSFVRNLHGTNISVDAAMQHARNVVDFERYLHMFHELQVQHFFLRSHALMKFFNVWYGTAHFVVTIGVLLWLFLRHPNRYRKWRNVLAIATLCALGGYVLYPLAPPRLLPADFGFVDTLKTIGGLWNFDNGTVAKSSNQYAAMPSLHAAWSLWCAFALMPIAQHSWSRLLVVWYPALTILVVVATANHFWVDVFGGGVVFFIGYTLAGIWEDWRRRAGITTTREETIDTDDL